ncbi:MAG TPA: galactokinase [Chloroflexota bacterium]
MREIEQRADDAYRSRFGTAPEVVASAPGRINLIGEHTDYNGGFVLPIAISRRVAVAAGHGTGELYSVDFAEARAAGGCKGGSWADYPRGVAWALADAGHAIERFQTTISGDVPRGAGLSSSAAIESATAIALDALIGLGLSRQELAILCQRAENRYVGVNSGIMDQYASLLCQPDEALLIDCRSLEATSVPLRLEAAGLSLLVCNTRVERELGHTGYNERRASCEAAAQTLGVKQLRDATLGDLRRLSGIELKRARHVVTEDNRVLEAVAALERHDYAGFGSLMYTSHASLRDDYEVSTPELDAFVEVAADCGALGARLTGAGFGGCAIALVADDDLERLQTATLRRFEGAGYREPVFYVFRASAGAEVVR